MKRKLMAMTLALMMVLTVAISVSAATVTGGGTYEGYSYETTDTCNTHSFSSTTMYDSSDYSIYSDVTMNVTGYTSTGSTTTVSTLFAGNPSYLYATTSGSTEFTISSIHCVHYIAGANVYSAKVYPG